MLKSTKNRRAYVRPDSSLLKKKKKKTQARLATEISMNIRVVVNWTIDIHLLDSYEWRIFIVSMFKNKYILMNIRRTLNSIILIGTAKCDIHALFTCT